MNHQDKDIDLIIRCFDLALSDTELEAFEQQLLNDSAFRNKVETYKEAQRLINKNYPSNAEQLRFKKWKRLLKKQEAEKLIKRPSWKWLGGIAAACILFFSIWQLTFTSSSPNMEQHITNAWNKKVGLDYTAFRNATKDTIKQKIVTAFKFYKTKNYQSALNALRHYKTATPYYEDVLLLKGLSYYRKGKTTIALKTLDTLSLYPTGKKRDVARWYLGLIHLEQGNTKVAKRFLVLPENSNETITLKE